MEKHGNRDELVIATKYSGAYRPRDNAEGVVNINNEGNARKNSWVSLGIGKGERTVF